MTYLELVPILREQVLRVKDLDSVPMCVVGNKCDLVKLRQVPTTEGRDLARSLGADFKEASAKSCENVEETFYDLVRAIRRSRGEPKDSGKNAKKIGHKKCKIL